MYHLLLVLLTIIPINACPPNCFSCFPGS